MSSYLARLHKAAAQIQHDAPVGERVRPIGLRVFTRSRTEYVLHVGRNVRGDVCFLAHLQRPEYSAAQVHCPGVHSVVHIAGVNQPATLCLADDLADMVAPYHNHANTGT